MTTKLHLKGDEDTRALGERLARVLADSSTQADCVVYLKGPLGAGKSTLARGLIKALGHSGAVPSPTYSIAESYLLPRFEVLHLDLYRLADPEEVEYLGVLDSAANSNEAEKAPTRLILVEWPERGIGAIPPADLVISLSYADQRRRAELRGNTSIGIELLNKIV